MSLPPEEKNTVSPIQMAELLSSAAQAYWWTYNWQSDCFSCSDQLYNLLGLPRATRITYALLSAYVLHDDLGRIYQLIHTLPPSEKLHDIIRFTVQGKILWFENNVTYFPATQERGAYAVGLMHDVTWLCERQSQASTQSPELSMIPRSMQMYRPLSVQSSTPCWLNSFLIEKDNSPPCTRLCRSCRH